MVFLIFTFFRYFGTVCMTIDNALVVEPKKDIFSLKLVKVSDGNPIWTFFTGPHPKYSRGGLNLLLELLHLPLHNCTKQFFLPPLEFFFQSDLQEIINALYDMVWKMWVCLSVRFSNFGYLMIFTHIFSIPISHKMHFMHAYLYIHQFWSSLSAHVKLQYVQLLTRLDHPNVDSIWHKSSQHTYVL